MQDNFTHTKKENPDYGQNPFVDLNPPYSRTKEDVWSEIINKIDTDKSANNKVISLFQRQMFRYAVAAVAVVLIGLPLFMRLYTKTITTEFGEHAELALPDESHVNINAGSSVSYHPYWWHYNRNVNLNGEAYFEVIEGKSFTVKSDMGETTVLGTSFNIYARNDNYAVTCLTGSVKVSDYNQSVIISPYESAEFTDHNPIVVSDNVEAENAMAWVNDVFVYTGEALNRVISDIEIQYNIQIKNPYNINIGEMTYSGNFDRSLSSEKVLYFVLKPFGLNVQKADDGEYVIQYEN